MCWQHRRLPLLNYPLLLEDQGQNKLKRLKDHKPSCFLGGKFFGEKSPFSSPKKLAVQLAVYCQLHPKDKSETREFSLFQALICPGLQRTMMKSKFLHTLGGGWLHCRWPTSDGNTNPERFAVEKVNISWTYGVLCIPSRAGFWVVAFPLSKHWPKCALLHSSWICLFLSFHANLSKKGCGTSARMAWTLNPTKNSPEGSTGAREKKNTSSCPHWLTRSPIVPNIIILLEEHSVRLHFIPYISITYIHQTCVLARWCLGCRMLLQIPQEVPHERIRISPVGT